MIPTDKEIKLVINKNKHLFSEYVDGCARLLREIDRFEALLKTQSVEVIPNSHSEVRHREFLQAQQKLAKLVREYKL